MTWGGVFKYSSIRKTKGFTLIELLAVIVVLAIIALIAVPIVLNIIEKSREGAAITSARNYIKAIETYVVTSELDKNKLNLDKNNKYSVTKDTIIESKNYIKTNDLVSLKGSFPTGLDDYVILGETKQVTEARLTINGYEIKIQNDKVVSIVKGKKIAVENISLNKTKETMERGSTFTLEASFNPENASDQRVKYTSNNEEIVTVTEEGVVTAKNIGNAKIIVTSVDNTSKKAECEITVIASATDLKIEPTEAEIKIGEKVTLIGLIEPSDATTSSLTWATSDINIANVDENGIVTGISKGEATITATTVNGISATSKITVNEIYAESISLNRTSATLENGQTLQLYATITPNDTTNKTVTWTSSNNSVATVDSNGLVTAKGQLGTATITVRTSNGKTATANITVNKTYLANMVSVGDYVAYDAGTWTETKEKPTTQGQFGGYTEGQNKSNSVKCINLTTLKGWRVLKIENNQVYIIHAGVPECYYHAGESALSITALNNRAISEYLNTTYASSAHMMNYDEALAITKSVISTDNNLRTIGDRYRLASSYSATGLYNVNTDGYIYSNIYDGTDGIRPVVALKSGVKTTGKTTDAVGQVAWSLIAP